MFERLRFKACQIVEDNIRRLALARWKRLRQRGRIMRVAAWCALAVVALIAFMGSRL